MKRLIFSSLAFLPLAVAIALVNYAIDPANIFKGREERQIARLILRGSNVATIANINERYLHKYLIRGLKNAPDEIILGSSRVMLISSKTVGDRSVMNHGVSGGTIEDLLALFYLYEERGLIPKKILLGLDPWMINDQNGEIRWKYLMSEYMSMMKKLELGISGRLEIPRKIFGIRIAAELLSPSIFQASIQTLMKNGMRLPPATFYATNDDVGKDMIRRVDGSISYDQKMRESSVERVDADAGRAVQQDPIDFLAHFERFSPQCTEILERFVEYVQDRGIDVEFYLAPFHPIFYDFLRSSSSYEISIETENYYSRLAKKNGLKIRGSFNPHLYGLDGSNFYDAFHCKEDVIKKILTIE